MLKSILKEICVKNKRAYVTNKFSMKIGDKNMALDFFPYQIINMDILVLYYPNKCNKRVFLIIRPRHQRKMSSEEMKTKALVVFLLAKVYLV